MAKINKALSLRQPFAEQIIRGKKKNEYRSKVTHFRGRLYIYAALGRFPPEDWKGTGIEPYTLPTGVLIGTVEIVDCKPDPDGGYIWKLANPKRLRTPLVPDRHPQPMFFQPFDD